ncbi:hypothetical protein [Mycolicibacter arupensis]|uniref:Uncharacterized protein n=1 Tax=Mycolicibacter arupensis TaxID=342002 RepID=A0A0F5MXQ2_9MYCO|nr:hypothetical protein [Mycolicibacter arupensis]KKB99598.1 hypothetical protein WR43_08840 [Mycolicibacter arupensis]MCV7274887.1 hypothetical protein [Mycolicibacter arupensis]OQZ93596.1 hypothetical protein BST15_17850 [Mycolicibacter arupensis]
MSNNTEPVDGTVYVLDARPDEGIAYITIAGPDEDHPMIVMFDRDDLDALNRVRKELKCHRPEPDPGAVLRILNEASRHDIFVHDRVEYRYNSLEGKWLAWGRVDTDDDPQPATTRTTSRKWW